MRAALAGVALMLASAGQAGAACKLALALALDISSSVNSREYDIQLQGLARAFRQPQVQRAILAPDGAFVAVLAYEWSGENQQRVIDGWTILDTAAAIDGFADRLADHRRSATELPTAIGEALRFGADRLREAPRCARRTLDISGDGSNNDGPSPEIFRAQGLLDGITINGLTIEGAYPNPSIYYEEKVIQGPGAFLARARDFEDYPRVIIDKLLREIDPEIVVGDSR